MNENKQEIDIMETLTNKPEAKKYDRISTAEKKKFQDPRGDKSYYTYSIEHPERDIHKIFFPRKAKVTNVCICIEDMEASKVGIAIHIKVVGSNTMYPTNTVDLKEGINHLPDFEVIPNTVFKIEALGEDHTKIKGLHISFQSIQ